LFAAYLDCPVDAITGRGTGIADERVRHKARIIQAALDTNRALLTDPLNTLAAVGGLEIAGICGFVLGAAAHRLPVIVDGFISTAGAVAACAMQPATRDYLLFSHMSQEQGHRHILEKLDAKPILDLDMRLGEGTGAALAMTVVDAALKIYNEMATFSAAGVSDKDG
jgi:nicotinate-nucleotide--dimethylbenzimidazole phosphoribosyltransferase